MTIFLGEVFSAVADDVWVSSPGTQESRASVESAHYHDLGPNSSLSSGGFPQDFEILGYFQQHACVKEAVLCRHPEEAVERAQDLYTHHTQELRNALSNPQGFQASSSGLYPFLGAYIHTPPGAPEASYGVVNEAGFYGTTLSQPSLFSAYLVEQLTELKKNHEVVFIVGNSDQRIPLSFLGDHIFQEVRDFAALKSLLAMPVLHTIDDEIVNGIKEWHDFPIKPLSLFSAQRLDYSLGRLKHYCGTSPEYFQNFVLLSNYQRYIDGFFAYAQSLKGPHAYTHWVEPTDRAVPLEDLPSTYHRDAGHSFQMPAYHLTRPDKNGITLINIGVGPSNTKTITDHLAVMRPHCWMMLGHCGGLHYGQRLGDYVLASGYMRDDDVLNQDLPLHIPIPPMQGIHRSIFSAATDIMGPQECEKRFRCGTVISTSNRHWELRIKEFSHLINASRALAIDMESTTLAANAFRFSIPYATLLCVSDRPLHGELKLHGQARSFYQEKVANHLLIGIKAMEHLATIPAHLVHSRKLRGIQTPAFR